MLNLISTDLIHPVALDRRALSRLSHHSRSFLMTERDNLDSFFLFSNFARQRARLCKGLRERSEEKSSRDEKRRAWRVTVSRFDIVSIYGSAISSIARSKFRSRRFHVRINTIYARLVFPVREDSAAVVPPISFRNGLLLNLLSSHRINISMLTIYNCTDIFNHRSYKYI